ncbi:MAG: hypothetical protein ABEH81_08520 [Halopenitus sp.]
MSGNHRDRDPDRTGFDDTTNYLTAALARIVPTWVARRAVTVSVATDKDTYEPGEPVEITVEFDNRLPVPVEVPTRGQRRWGWAVDDVLEADDATRYVSGDPLTFPFRAGETKTVTTVWNGHFRRTTEDDLDRSEPAEPGEHTIQAFLATAGADERPEATTAIRID